VSSAFHDADHVGATILGEDDAEDRRTLADLRADPTIEFIDGWADQTESLRRLRPVPHPDTLTEPKQWAYYPWRRTVVGVLGPRAFRAVRLDRNRNLITTDEQDRLGQLRVGVIGLSVGHAIAYTLAAEGLCGQLRLADFDELELSNLNRVPATVFDQGLNKATVAARRIAELDPYIAVRVIKCAITPGSVDEFVHGLDILVEECDSLDAKVLVRESARARRIPVLMATSDRGLLDVERFDLERSRPIFHGLLGEVDTAKLAGLSSRDKLPHVLRILDAGRLSPRMAASLVELDHTLTTWPQLAGDVALGAAAVAEAVRRIGLREELRSGRIRIDIAATLDEIEDPGDTMRQPPPVLDGVDQNEPATPAEIVASAAIRAPSGGNAQPWHVVTQDDSIEIVLVPEYTSTMDVGLRASAVAVGAAAFNAKVAAAAHRRLGPVEMEHGDEASPLHATLRLSDGDDPELAQLYQPMLLRETNRNRGNPVPITSGAVKMLESVARREGARLRLLRTRDEIERAAAILAEADRIRYLTPRLHAEMFSELRWPGDESPDSGIDIASLELDPGDLVKLDVLRRPEVMAHLAEWDVGAVLRADTRDRVLASSGLAIVSVQGRTLADYARGGSAIEAVWIIAQQSGLAVQPTSPVFLYAHDRDDLQKLSPSFASSLHHLQSEFHELAGTGPGESQVLVLRFSGAVATSVRSRRRSPTNSRGRST
jgi:molybdopterin/thiamine biosynthesis adenylyltransferase